MVAEITPNQSRVTTGATWLIAARIADRVFGFASIACLARLLTPADFGLVAMAGSVGAFLEVLSAFGFDWALVRHPAPTRMHYDSAWSLRLAVGVLTAALLVISGPFAAAFYKQPAVTALLAALGLSTIVGATENIGAVDFRRNFEFGKEFWLRTISRIVGSVVAVGVAYWSHSYWALVIGILATRSAATVLSYALHPFRPRWSTIAGRELMGFSSWLLVTNIIDFARVRFADFFVGRVFGPRATGLYSVANELAHLSITELAAPINRVVFSMYSQASGDQEAIKRGFLQVASLIWMAALPMAAGIIAVSEEIVAVMLGPHWTGAAVLLRILAVGGGLAVMTANIHYVYLALGNTRLSTILAAVGLVAMVALAPTGGALFGVNGVGAAYVATTALGIPLNYFMLRRLIGIRFLDLWRRVWRCLAAAIGMLAVIALALPMTQPSDIAAATSMLALKVALGAASYTLILGGLWALSGRPDGPERFVIGVAARRILALRKKISGSGSRGRAP